MRMKLILRAPDIAQPQVLDLTHGEAVLVGREPDPSKLPPMQGSVRPVSLPSARVSGNHILIEHGTEGAALTDLGSSNGTSLQLVPWQKVHLSGGVATLDLARTQLAALNTRPADAKWGDAEQFAREVRAEVEAWLRGQGIRADAKLLRRAPEAPPRGTVTFALADGSALLVQRDASTTLTTGWLTQVRVYVHGQNLLFEEERGHDDGFVMASKAFRDAHREVVSAAQRGLPLVLLGETGSGKEVLARCYHMHSPRRDRRMEVVNCATMALNENLAAKDLFGAVKGAHSDLTRDVDGALTLANGGTLFLDEVGELPPGVQAALLRFLNKRPGEFHRLGEPDRVCRSDVQIVIATNKDIEAEVEAGAFRSDLWNRVAGAVVHVPPLRERRDDLEAFLHRRRVFDDRSVYDALTREARALVLAHNWPGNFRELDHFVERLESEMLVDPCDAPTCQRLLRVKGPTPHARSVVVSLPPSQAADDQPVRRDAWRSVLDGATTAWLEDHRDSPPATWNALGEFLEDYVKPLFLAEACGVREGAPWPATYTERGRRVGIKDGTSTKKSFDRYENRFAPKRSGS